MTKMKLLQKPLGKINHNKNPLLKKASMGNIAAQNLSKNTKMPANVNQNVKRKVIRKLKIMQKNRHK